MTTFEEILAALPKLEPSQRAEIAARIQLLQSAPISDALDIVYPALRTMLNASICPPLFVVRRNMRCSKLVMGCRVLIEFINEVTRTKDERKQLMPLCILFAKRQVIREGTPLNIWTVGHALARIGEIVESQFPGYTDSGLLYMFLHPVIIDRRDERRPK